MGTAFALSTLAAALLSEAFFSRIMRKAVAEPSTRRAAMIKRAKILKLLPACQGGPGGGGFTAKGC
ncbi:Uncharacterised protein [uncultured archaeon]|nr:Uncharacterised protein [uncultured archaeon]